MNPDQKDLGQLGPDGLFVSRELQSGVAEQLNREVDADQDKALDAYHHHNGRYREEEFCERARQLGRDVRKVTRCWLDVREVRRQRRKDEAARLEKWAKGLLKTGPKIADEPETLE